MKLFFFKLGYVTNVRFMLKCHQIQSLGSPDATYVS